jgi:hypothetical protein
MRNVPLGVKQEGHQIVHLWPEDDRYHVFIRKRV